MLKPGRPVQVHSFTTELLHWYHWEAQCAHSTELRANEAIRTVRSLWRTTCLSEWVTRSQEQLSPVDVTGTADTLTLTCVRTSVSVFRRVSVKCMLSSLLCLCVCAFVCACVCVCVCVCLCRQGEEPRKGGAMVGISVWSLSCIVETDFPPDIHTHIMCGVTVSRMNTFQQEY